MTDIYPALAAIYPPEALQDENKSYPLYGFSDEGATRFTDCRVIVHNSKAFVGADSIRGPKTVFQGTYTPENVFSNGSVTRVLTDSGHLIVFGPSKGCGCGSRLRSWNPYVQSNGIARSEGRK